jgi:hypothetical protein
MKVYEVTDQYGSMSIHFSVSKEAAIQAHMIHFGLLWLEGDVQVSDGLTLDEWHNAGRERDEICWDKFCCLVGAHSQET